MAPERTSNVTLLKVCWVGRVWFFLLLFPNKVHCPTISLHLSEGMQNGTRGKLMDSVVSVLGRMLPSCYSFYLLTVQTGEQFYQWESTQVPGSGEEEEDQL